MSLPAQIAMAILAVIVDMVVLFALGVVVIYVEYLIQGLSVTELMKLGPVCLVNAAVFHVWVSRFFANPTYAAFNKRHSKWVAFGCYYAIIFVGGYFLGRCEFYVFRSVFYYIPQAKIPGLISFHQLLTFVVLTSHNAWFDGVFLKGAHAFASFVIQFFVTYIVWGIWCHNTVTLEDNSGQLGGFLLWIPLTNLYSLSIYHDLDLSNTFPNIVTRVGFLAFACNIINFISWAVCYGLTYAIHKSTFSTMTKWDIGHSIHNMAAATLIPYLVIGHRLSPYIFKRMCLKPNGDKKWVTIFFYWVLMTILAFALSIAVFVYVHKFFYDVMLCKVIQIKPTVEQCLDIEYYHRSVAFFGFGVGTIYIAFVEGKMFSRDAVHLHHETKTEIKDVETAVLEPTISSISSKQPLINSLK